MKKTGLFFGSFNPIHIGHMMLANYMVEFTEMEEIWFIVSPQNPFKKKTTLLNSYDRLVLVEKAIGDDFRFQASNVEFNLPQPSYTIDTLTYLSEQYPQRSFAIIMGEDGLNSFHKWKNYEEIIQHYPRYVYPRHDSKHNTPDKNQNIRFIEAPRIEISASFLRDAIHEEKDVRHFFPDAVYQHIIEMHFYQP